MWRVYQTLSRATGILVLLVGLMGVAGPAAAQPCALADNAVHGRRGDAHLRPEGLRPGLLPCLLPKPEAALSLSGHAQYPEYR